MFKPLSIKNNTNQQHQPIKKPSIMSYNFSRTTYVRPQVEVVDVSPEGVLCQSGDRGTGTGERSNRYDGIW
jgi:hypothetical protein